MEWLYYLERNGSAKDALASRLSGCSEKGRKRIMAVMAHGCGFSANAIAEHLALSRNKVRRCLAIFNAGGIDSLLGRKLRPRKADNEEFGKALFGLLHEPPALSGFHRTTWRMDDLRKTLSDRGFPASDEVICRRHSETGTNLTMRNWIFFWVLLLGREK